MQKICGQKNTGTPLQALHHIHGKGTEHVKRVIKLMSCENLHMRAVCPVRVVTKNDSYHTIRGFLEIMQNGNSDISGKQAICHDREDTLFPQIQPLVLGNVTVSEPTSKSSECKPCRLAPVHPRLLFKGRITDHSTKVAPFGSQGQG